MITLTKIKPYKCSFCDAAFNQRNLLDKHVKMHSNHPANVHHVMTYTGICYQNVLERSDTLNKIGVFIQDGMIFCQIRIFLLE